MKYAIITSLFFSLLFGKESTTQIKVDGMQCSYSCAGKVNSVVQKMDGVKNSSVDFAKGIATVTYDEKKVTRNEIIKNLMLKNKLIYIFFLIFFILSLSIDYSIFKPSLGTLFFRNEYFWNKRYRKYHNRGT